MTYVPNPVDTEHIELSEQLLQLTETLAAHAHDIWARERLAQGWTYGPQRNDALKQHPDLVSYEQLDDAEKQFDRNAALATLKLIAALGYVLTPPSTAASDDDPLLTALQAASSQTANNMKSELGALLDIWNKRRDDAPAWQSSPAPYRYLAARFLKLGAAPLAKEVARAAFEYSVPIGGRGAHQPWANDIELCLTFGCSLARTANTAQAQHVLSALHDRLRTISEQPVDDAQRHIWQETLGMLARTYKDQWEQASDPAPRQELLVKSLAMYERAYQLSGGYWTGINVATLARIGGDEQRAAQAASEVRDQCLAALATLSPQNHDEKYWLLATLGEAALVLGNFRDAQHLYRQAYSTAPKAFGNLHATRRNAGWLLRHWQLNTAQLDDWLPLPKVVVFAGHMIDSAGRTQARFPARMAAPVKAAIKDWLRQHNALVGFSSAACGADILFQEALHELGGECRVILPFHEDRFVIESVALIPDGDWPERFAAVLGNAVQVVRTSRAPLLAGDVAHDFANRVLHGIAVRRAAELATPLLGLAVWDGAPDDAVASSIAGWQKHGVPVFRVDSSIADAAAITLAPVSAAAPPAAATMPTTVQGRVNDRRVTALLFADAVGFSNLPDAEVPLFVHEYLGRIARLLDEYEILRLSTPALLADHGAGQRATAGTRPWTAALNPHVTVRETWGDGLFLAFPSLHDAGEFALRLTALVRDTDWRSLGFSQPISLRVALHAGPVYADTDPITRLPKAIGSHISAAARLEPKTPPGEIYASEAFAALLALERESTFVCDYVEQLEWGKHYGTFPTYVVRYRAPPQRSN